MKTPIYIVTGAVALTLGLVVAGCSGGDNHQNHNHGGDAAGTEKSAEHARGEPGAAKPYPLEKCLVSDEELGAMGDPYVFVHEGQEVKMCCKGCLDDFNADPGKYLAKLKQ